MQRLSGTPQAGPEGGIAAPPPKMTQRSGRSGVGSGGQGGELELRDLGEDDDLQMC